MSLLNPVNFLDLVQRTSFEAGIAGSGPTTVVNASGQTANLCNWVNQAWIDIQTRHPDWKFKRVSPGVSFATIAGQLIYTPTEAGVSAGVSAWDRHTFRVYNTVAGQASELRMTYWDYDDWRDMFQISSLRTGQVLPVNFTILPNLSLGLQCPLAGYTITGDYYTIPIGFTADADIPSIPNRFIMLIVFEALKSYALYESAPEVFTRAEREAHKLMTRLENDQLPEIYAGSELA